MVHVDALMAQLHPAPHPHGCALSLSLTGPMVRQILQKHCAGKVKVTLSELKASQSLVLCEELQKTTKVMTLSHGLALCAHTVARDLHVSTAIPSFY